MERRGEYKGIAGCYADVMARWKIILFAASLGIVISAYTFATRRPDLTDPAELAKLPPNELRDAEVECLVRAAFADARSVRVRSEAVPSITISDREIIGRLSEEFAVGYDAEQLPMYRHPGLEYTAITFEGKEAPTICFTGPNDAMLLASEPGRFRRFGVRARFARLLADLLHLELATGPSRKKQKTQ
jgi:hypothetical protein